MGGVGSTFLLEWLKRVERSFQAEADACAPPSSSPSACRCREELRLPRHLISCHVDDDGIFKHLSDPALLEGFGATHRAVFVVGDPVDAVASVFRRRFQCWHLHRLHNCWFSRAQRRGRIDCPAAAITELRRQFGDEAVRCRVPSVGPLASLDAYAAHGHDVFGAARQFAAWLSCRRPRCAFDILVLRYESLNASLPALWDFLELPPRLRQRFPLERLHARRRRHGEVPREGLAALYAPLGRAVAGVPAGGLLLRNDDREASSVEDGP